MKSGSHWTHNDLVAYNIEVQIEPNGLAFFEVDGLPEPHVPGDEMLMLTALEAEDVPDGATYDTLAVMGLAMNPRQGEESAVDDFAVLLLRLLGYNTRGTALHTRQDIELMICGLSMHAKTDCAFCGIEQRSIMRNVEPRLQDSVIPGILMIGTSPIFYRIRVTRELDDAVRFGTCPANPTLVHYHLSPLPLPERRLSEGMKPLDNRHTILQCYEAFKRFVHPQDMYGI